MVLFIVKAHILIDPKNVETSLLVIFRCFPNLLINEFCLLQKFKEIHSEMAQ